MNIFIFTDYISLALLRDVNLCTVLPVTSDFFAMVHPCKFANSFALIVKQTGGWGCQSIAIFLPIC